MTKGNESIKKEDIATRQARERYNKIGLKYNPIECIEFLEEHGIDDVIELTDPTTKNTRILVGMGTPTKTNEEAVEKMGEWLDFNDKVGEKARYSLNLLHMFIIQDLRRRGFLQTEADMTVIAEQLDEANPSTIKDMTRYLNEELGMMLNLMDTQKRM